MNTGTGRQPGRSARRGGRVALVGLAILLVSSAHYFTPTSLHLFHDIYDRLYYLPIIIAGLWFGVKGGVGAALISGLLYAPHILFQWGILPSMSLERYMEILLFNIVGLLTGLLSERVRRQRDLYQKTSEKLEQAYGELEQRSSRLLLLEKRLRRLEMTSALGEFSAVVAHELMNPLGSIKGAIEILADDFPETHQKHLFLGILVKEIDRLERTIRDVLRFRSPDRIVRTACAPDELIDAVLTLIQVEAGQRGIRVERLRQQGVRALPLDADKVQQSLLNLIMNAIQAMSNGGVLRVLSEWGASAPEWAETKGGDRAGGLLIAVSDTGTGIPEADLERVFEPFFSTREEGTGLGLAVVKRIVEAHRGGVRVESRPGAGTTFSVWLPDTSAGERG